MSRATISVSPSTGPEEKQKICKELSKDFFDLIIIDECHRGSAAEDFAWREILEHFSSASQIGLTATPKETEYVSNSQSFGDPVQRPLRLCTMPPPLRKARFAPIHFPSHLRKFRDPAQPDQDV